MNLINILLQEIQTPKMYDLITCNSRKDKTNL